MTLQGCVRTYHLKQLAQAAVMSVAGVEAVDNQIVVTEGRPRRIRGLSWFHPSVGNQSKRANPEVTGSETSQLLCRL